MKTGCIAMMFATLVVASAHAADAWRLPDPTRPASAASFEPEAPRGLVLQSTLVSPGRKTAVISGRAVGIGDKIDGKEVLEITAYEVILGKGRATTTLRLAPLVGTKTSRQFAAGSAGQDEFPLASRSAAAQK